MPSFAAVAVDWIETHPEATRDEKMRLLDGVPPQQWAVHGGFWGDLSKHCPSRAEVPLEPRFMNRLSIYRMEPMPRCLLLSPDGKGLRWLLSGGEVESYGRCLQCDCPRATPTEELRHENR